MINLTAVKPQTYVYCRCCQFVIQLGKGDLEDQRAQDRGFIDTEHETVYEAVKAADYKEASR